MRSNVRARARVCVFMSFLTFTITILMENRLENVQILKDIRPGVILNLKRYTTLRTVFIK